MMPGETKYKQFLMNQERVYDKFRNARPVILANGIKAHTLTGKGGYIVAFRHSPEISLDVGRVSEQINGQAPSLVYGQNNTHTTICDYGIVDNFTPDKLVLNTLAEGVNDAISGVFSPAVIYTSWLMNQDSVIAAGIPNQDLTELAEAVNMQINDRNIKSRLAWGAHISVNRFKVPQNPQTANGLIELLDTTLPLGESYPTTIDVGYYTIDEHNFNFVTDKRFEL